MNEKLIEFMNSEEYIKSVASFAGLWFRQSQRTEKRVQVMRNKISLMSDSEFLSFVVNLCEWEKRFEERYYKKRILTTSNMFNLLFDAVSEKGNSRPCNEDFLTQKYIYKGLTFKLYCGQGCFFRITMRKRLIFQST